MTPTWLGNDDYVTQRAPKGLESLRVIRRGVPAIFVIAACLVLLLLVRLIERPLFAERRPVTPYITCFVCRSVIWLIGFRYVIHGRPMSHPGAVVANHASWLDIFTLNAPQRIYFVSKSEVAGWPGIGVLAKATGTVFIARQRSEAKRQQSLFEARLRAGHKLLFFPEGTSTDAHRVLPFKTTLFEAFFSEALRDQSFVQAITVNYHAPEGEDPRYYGWWGDMDLVPNVLHILSTPKQGKIELVFHAPHPVNDYENRKQLALDLEQTVRGAHFSSKSAPNPAK
jgi:1-acyl-sn-glycerol-3-phosphate acyltransferase